VLMVSVLWLMPITLEAGTTGEQPPEQRQIISNDDFKRIHERLTAEGVYAGPRDGGWNAQTEAALRPYQAKRGLSVSVAADEKILRRHLQSRLPANQKGEW
jgi:peptidoglycan hydrolase-like protein with peptidoglycan-binding domain